MSLFDSVVCVSTNHWTGLPTSKQHLMEILSRRVPVLYVDPPIDIFSVLGRRRRWPKLRGLRRVSAGPWVLSPVALDNRSSRRGARAARMRDRAVSAARRLGLKRPVLWTYAPGHAPYVGAFDERIAVYQAADDPAAFSDDPERTAADERRHIEAVDLVFTASRALKEERLWSGKAVRLPNAADAAHYERALGWSRKAGPEEVLRAVERLDARPGDLPTGRPIALYGGAAYDWFDDDLLSETARMLPGVEFVLVGPACRRVASRRFPPNVTLLGRRSYGVFPRYVASADCAVLPWRRGRFSEHADPIVLYELLLCGLPVVATPFPAAVERGDLVRTADEPETFAGAVRDALDERDTALAGRRVAFGLANTWEDRVMEATRSIQGVLDRTETAREG